jgi:hypothetical protein
VGEVLLPNVEHPARAVMQVDADTVLVATAAPTLGAEETSLVLSLAQVRYGDPAVDEPVVAPVGRAFVVSSLPTSSSEAGPRLPALAFLPPNKLALGYIEPDLGLTVVALRVQRYDVCLPAN